MTNVNDLIKHITEREYEFLHKFRGHSGRCFLIVTKRFSADYGERQCRWLIALTERLFEDSGLV
jgi:hypothetical protein